MTIAALLDHVDNTPAVHEAPISILRHAVRRKGSRRPVRIIKGGSKLI